MFVTPTAEALARYLSLSTQQMKLTAENMANQNTAGYTRRVVSFEEGDTVRFNAASSAGASASGVSASVAAQRDRVLQRTVQQATEAAGASSTRLAALNTLQGLFAIGSSGDDASGIGAAIGGFFNAASALAASPSDATGQQTLLTAAQTLASTSNRASTQIAAQAASLNQQVSSSVSQVNDLASQVAALNQQLAQATTSEGRDTITDQRDKLVTQISQLVGVNTVAGEHGEVDLALTGGVPLVLGSSSLPLVTANVSGATRVYAAASAGGADLTSMLQGGTLGGALQARDTDLVGVSSQLDAIAGAIATAVNAQNAQGLTSSGVAGGAIFSGSTAGTLAVVASSGSDFAATASGGAAGGNLAAMANLQAALLVGGRTPAKAFSALIANLGTTASAADTQSTADTAVLTQTQAQVDDVSGVSLDQEAANLTQYQRSYEAAAKVLSIVNSLLAQAINLGEQTTVS